MTGSELEKVQIDWPAITSHLLTAERNATSLGLGKEVVLLVCAWFVFGCWVASFLFGLACGLEQSDKNRITRFGLRAQLWNPF